MRSITILLLVCAVALADSYVSAQSLRVLDINPGPASSAPEGLVPLDGKLYFFARVGGDAPEIWSYDPGTHTATIAGTLDGHISSSMATGSVASVDGKIFFNSRLTGESPYSVWAFDTASGEVTRIYRSPDGASIAPRDFLIWNGLLLFTASDEKTQRRYFVHYPDLVRTDELGNDRVEAGTPLVPAFARFYFGGTYYPEGGGTRTAELFELDPPSTVTIAVDGLTSRYFGGARYITRPETNFLYFLGSKEGGPYGVWWAYHLGTTTAEIVKGTEGFGANPLGHNTSAIAANGRVYTWKYDGTNPTEIWALNATLGAYRVTGLPARPTSWDLTYFDGALYFTLDDGDAGVELWRTAGEDGVEMLADINPHNDRPGPGSHPRQLTAFDGRLYFTATDGSSPEDHGTELWIYDPAGTDTKTEEAPAMHAGRPALSFYPNPTLEAGVVTLALPSWSEVRLAAYDVQGRQVAVLHDGRLPQGKHELRFDTSGLPSGVYLVRALTTQGAISRSVTVVR